MFSLTIVSKKSRDIIAHTHTQTERYALMAYKGAIVTATSSINLELCVVLRCEHAHTHNTTTTTPTTNNNNNNAIVCASNEWSPHTVFSHIFVSGNFSHSNTHTHTHSGNAVQLAMAAHDDGQLFDVNDFMHNTTAVWSVAPLTQPLYSVGIVVLVQDNLTD